MIIIGNQCFAKEILQISPVDLGLPDNVVIVGLPSEIIKGI